MLKEYKPYLNRIDHSLNLELPNNETMIKQVKKAIYNIDDKINKINPKFDLDFEKYDEYYNRITNILYFIADLSIPCYEHNEPLKEYYWKNNKSNPSLAICLWQCHYMLIHDEYTALKNKCYHMYYKLDTKFNLKNSLIEE